METMTSLDSRASVAAFVPMEHAGAMEPVILVIDDDLRTRRFICTLLKYSTKALVLHAGSPQAALETARGSVRPIDLIISDIDLRDAKTGIDVSLQICRENPFVKVTLLSGRDRRPENIPDDWRFLAKPFLVRDLLDCIDALTSAV